MLRRWNWESKKCQDYYLRIRFSHQTLPSAVLIWVSTIWTMDFHFKVCFAWRKPTIVAFLAQNYLKTLNNNFKYFLAKRWEKSRGLTFFACFWCICKFKLSHTWKKLEVLWGIEFLMGLKAWFWNIFWGTVLMRVWKLKYI